MGEVNHGGQRAPPGTSHTCDQRAAEGWQLPCDSPICYAAGRKKFVACRFRLSGLGFQDLEAARQVRATLGSLPWTQFSGFLCQQSQMLSQVMSGVVTAAIPHHRAYEKYVVKRFSSPSAYPALKRPPLRARRRSALRVARRHSALGVARRSASLGARRRSALGVARLRSALGVARRRPALGVARRHSALGVARRSASLGARRRSASLGARRRSALGVARRRSASLGARRRSALGVARRRPGARRRSASLSVARRSASLRGAWRHSAALSGASRRSASLGVARRRSAALGGAWRRSASLGARRRSASLGARRARRHTASLGAKDFTTILPTLSNMGYYKGLGFRVQGNIWATTRV